MYSNEAGLHSNPIKQHVSARFVCKHLTPSLSVYRSAYLYIYIYIYIYMSLCLSVSLPLYLSISLSLYIYISLIVGLYLSISMSLCLSISLSLYLCTSTIHTSLGPPDPPKKTVSSPPHTHLPHGHHHAPLSPIALPSPPVQHVSISQKHHFASPGYVVLMDPKMTNCQIPRKTATIERDL